MKLLEERINFRPKSVRVVRIRRKCCKDGLRQCEHRRCKDHRNNAAHIDLQRKARFLPAKCLVADASVCVTYRDIPSRRFNVNDDRDQCDHDDDEEHDAEGRSCITAANAFRDLSQATRQPNDDTCEDEQRDAVADTAFGDLFTEPHHEDRAGRKRDDDHRRRNPAVCDDLVPREPCRNKESLNGTKANGRIARPLIQLLSADLAFFLDLLYRRREHRHQLHNDRRSDIRRNAKSKDRDRAEVSAREKVQYPEQRACNIGPNCFETNFIDSGCCNVSTKAIDRQKSERKEDPLPQLGDPEHILDRVKKLLHKSLGLKRSDQQGHQALKKIYRTCYPICVAVPPAFSIFSFAVFVKR